MLSEHGERATAAQHLNLDRRKRRGSADPRDGHAHPHPHHDCEIRRLLPGAPRTVKTMPSLATQRIVLFYFN